MPVNVIGTLKPKNNGKFPVAEAVDIKVTDDLRLDEALENKADLSTVNFALDNKADKTTTTSLQSQINEIITPVTQDAEVQNARVGTDGTSYQTLKARLDAEFETQSAMTAQINEELSVFDNDFYYASEISAKTELNGKYIRTDGSIGDDSSNSGYYFKCEPNEEYIVCSSSACDYIVVGLTNDTGVAYNTEFQTVIKKNNVNHVKFTTTSSANYIYYYTTTTDISNLSVKKLTSKVDILTTEVESEIANIDNEIYDFGTIGSQTALNGKYIRTDGSIGDDSSNSGYYFKCKPNSKYKITSTSLLDYIDIGFTSDTGVAYNTRFDEMLREKVVDSVIFTTNSTANYVFYYTKSTDISNLNITKLNSKISEIRDEISQYYLHCKMEKGGLRSGYPSTTVSAHINEERTSHSIKLAGATKVSIEEINTTVCNAIVIYYYDSSMNFISGEIKETTNSDNSFNIIENAMYIRLALDTINTPVEEIKVKLSGCTSEPKLVKNSGLANTSYCATFDTENDSYTFARYILPPNYSAEGEKVPLILWMDGTYNMYTWAGDFSEGKLPYLQYLVDEGFAVISIFGWGRKMLDKYPDCIRNYPFPTPTNIASIKAGINWICDRYNIDYNNINIMSKSQGGQCATYFCSNPPFPIRSIGMFAPVNDYLSMPGGSTTYNDVRKAIADDMNWTGDISPYLEEGGTTYSPEVRAYLKGNMIKICGMNEAWTGLVGDTLENNFDSSVDDCEKFWTEQYWTDTTKTDIYTHTEYIKIGKIPIKIWGAKDDAETPYLKMAELVAQLQNGGTEAHLVTLPNNSGGHSCADVSLANAVDSVTTILGIVHTNVPIGWVENIEWIRSKMAK